MTFKLHEILERDSHYVTNFELCQVRLIDNSDYPWFILVPMKNNLIEITDLTEKDFDLLNHEVRKLAGILQNELKPDKLNIATIGNIVPQLHMHIIARFKDDKLFPKTVWGHDLTRYSDATLPPTIEMFQKMLKGYK
jgi:diadenosine tetraphosphate (Ap4A) HIT family hydrolase